MCKDSRCVLLLNQLKKKTINFKKTELRATYREYTQREKRDIVSEIERRCKDI